MTPSVAWSLVILAGLLEVVWAVGLKFTEGFTNMAPTTVVSVAMIGSIVLLGLAVKSIPIGTAYAVWVGVGVAGTAVAGIVLFGESASLAKLTSLGFVLIGIVGLNLAGRPA